jgi:hypothetical protein
VLVVVAPGIGCAVRGLITSRVTHRTALNRARLLTGSRSCRMLRSSFRRSSQKSSGSALLLGTSREVLEAGCGVLSAAVAAARSTNPKVAGDLSHSAAGCSLGVQVLPAPADSAAAAVACAIQALLALLDGCGCPCLLLLLAPQVVLVHGGEAQPQASLSERSTGTTGHRLATRTALGVC